MPNMQQLSLWGDAVKPESSPQRANDDAASRPPIAFEQTPDDAVMSLDSAAAPATDFDEESHEAPPMFKPLRTAIDAGVFGLDLNGPIEPDDHAVAALTQEHVHELICTLVEAEALQQAIRTGVDPRTGRMMKSPEATERATEGWRRELDQLQSNYANMLAAFEEGFGPDAMRKLDTWVRRQVAGTPRRLPYDPGHPWHYYWAGDNASPLAFTEIPPAEDAGRWLERDLPKNPAKRLARVRELLATETERLAEDRRRYDEIIENGVEALSRFDREIAYGGNDELACASSIALKYNHIRMGLGRVQWLREALEREQRWEPIHAARRTSSE